jgi:hypothetical protein
MKKIHGGSGKPQGTLQGGPKSRIYANHGGTNLPQGVVREPSSRPAVNAGGTFGMGTLKKRK